MARFKKTEKWRRVLPGFLPLIVCNMPEDFEMEEDGARNIAFSGRILVYPEEVDAVSTEIELSFIKFE